MFRILSIWSSRGSLVAVPEAAAHDEAETYPPLVRCVPRGACTSLIPARHSCMTARKLTKGNAKVGDEAPTEHLMSQS